ncbi:MAG: alanine racemase [Bacillota bacterium]|jgi:alanine racemase
MKKFTRWIEIDLDAIVHNFKEVKKLVSSQTKVLAVVKSDAYGHGAVEVARVLEKTGADMFAVTTVEEGVELVNNGIGLPVLILAPLLPFQIETVLDYRLIPTLDNQEVLKELNQRAGKKGVKALFHLKVETGMGRAGLMPQEVISFIRELENCSFVEMNGIYSHLATAMLKNKSYARKQFAIFKGLLEEIKNSGSKMGKAHLANSAALIDLPETHLDMVRVGTLLYGQYPSQYVSRKLNLKDPWQVKAVIISVKKLPPGSSVGYGREYVTKKEIEVGVVPIGYAEGFGLLPHTRPVKPYELFKSISRALANMIGVVPLNYVTKDGNKLPVVGRIGMQLCMIDITGCNIKAGDEVVLSMRRTTAGIRLPRIYFKNGDTYAVRGISQTISYAKPE